MTRESLLMSPTLAPLIRSPIVANRSRQVYVGVVWTDSRLIHQMGAILTVMGLAATYLVTR